MNKPTVIECFADNGSHSHWALIDTEDGKVLWDEFDEELNKERKEELLHKINEMKQSMTDMVTSIVFM